MGLITVKLTSKNTYEKNKGGSLKGIDLRPTAHHTWTLTIGLWLHPKVGYDMICVLIITDPNVN